MKKCSFFISAACAMLILALPLVACADYVSEPGNESPAPYQNELVLEYRDFLVQSSAGFIVASEAPGSSVEVGRLKHNEVCYVYHTYELGGEYWGYALYNSWESGAHFEGWVLMDQLLALYNRHEFYAEHEHDFHLYVGDYDELRQVDEVVLWAWPGSGRVEGTLKDEDFKNSSFKIVETYQDQQGHTWGWFWLPGTPEPFWICLSDPSNNSLPGSLPEPFPWTGATPTGYHVSSPVC